MRDRGHRNSNERGSSAQRRARKQFLLDKFGDGETAPCSEEGCGAVLTLTTIYVDRIVPAHQGGTYARDNIKIHCQKCSCRQGQRMRLELAKLANEKRCSVDGCIKVPPKSRRMCSMHATRLRRHGNVDTVLPGGRLSGSANPNWKDNQIGYAAAHQRVRKVRGPAPTHRCKCGAEAAQWAYDHADPNELTGVTQHGCVMSWSADPMRYEAMCLLCHMDADFVRRESGTELRLQGREMLSA